MTKSEATIKGHLAQSKKKRSKKINKSIREEQTHTDPVQEPNNSKTELVMATVEETHTIYTDQTESSQ